MKWRVKSLYSDSIYLVNPDMPREGVVMTKEGEGDTYSYTLAQGMQAALLWDKIKETLHTQDHVTVMEVTALFHRLMVDQEFHLQMIGLGIALEHLMSWKGEKTLDSLTGQRLLVLLHDIFPLQMIVNTEFEKPILLSLLEAYSGATNAVSIPGQPIPGLRE